MGTLEYLGVIVVAALLVGAVVTAVVRFDLGETLACELRSIGTQAGTCGGPEVPTTYDSDGSGDGAAASSRPADDGGGSDTPSTDPDYLNASDDQPTADQDKVDDASETIDDALDGGFWGVRGGDLEDAKDAVAALNGAEIDALIAGMDDAELEHWFNEMDDGWFGDGWDREQRRELWEIFAAKASRTTLDRLATLTDELQPRFDDVGGDTARDDPTSPANVGAYGEVEHALVVGSISPGDVSQGQLGDCWFVASMMAVAQADPGVIERAITANPNGTYTVRLYDDGSPVDVTVTPEMVLNPDGTPAFVANNGGTEPYEMWPMVLEKAMALHWGDYDDIESNTADVGLAALTGRPSENTDPGELSAAELDEILADGGAVALSSLKASDGKDSPLYDAERGSDVLYSGHAYYVSSVDVEKGLVTVVNPWGIASNPPITLTYDEFTQGFRQVRANEVS